MPFDPNDYEAVPKPEALAPTDPMAQGMDYLQKNYGWTPAAAAGIMGNLYHESGGLNPTAVGDGGKSVGLAQWNGPRLKALADYATQQGKPIDDPTIQLDFINHEMATDHQNLISDLMNADSPDAAARLFSRQYEKPGKPMMDSRVKASWQALEASGGKVCRGSNCGDMVANTLNPYLKAAGLPSLESGGLAIDAPARMAKETGSVLYKHTETPFDADNLARMPDGTFMVAGSGGDDSHAQIVGPNDDGERGVISWDKKRGTYWETFEEAARKIKNGKWSNWTATAPLEGAEKKAEAIAAKAQPFNPNDYEPVPTGEFNPADYEPIKKAVKPGTRIGPLEFGMGGGPLEAHAKEMQKSTEAGMAPFVPNVAGVFQMGARERLEAEKYGLWSSMSQFSDKFLGNAVDLFGKLLDTIGPVANEAGMPVMDRPEAEKPSDAAGFAEAAVAKQYPYLAPAMRGKPLPPDYSAEKLVKPLSDYFREQARKMAPDGKAPETFEEKVLAGIGTFPMMLMKYGISTALFGPAVGMAAVDTIEASDQPPMNVVEAAVTGLITGKVLAGAQPLTAPARIATVGGMFGFLSWLKGGDTTDVTSSIALGAGLAMTGGKGNVTAKEAISDAFTDFKKQYERLTPKQQTEGWEAVRPDKIQQEKFEEGIREGAFRKATPEELAKDVEPPRGVVSTTEASKEMPPGETSTGGEAKAPEPVPEPEPEPLKLWYPLNEQQQEVVGAIQEEADALSGKVPEEAKPGLSDEAMRTFVDQEAARMGAPGGPEPLGPKPPYTLYGGSPDTQELFKKIVGWVRSREAGFGGWNEGREVERVIKTVPYFHTIDDVRRIANKEGTVKVYHGAPRAYAESIIDKVGKGQYKSQHWNTADDILRYVAKVYDIPYTELRNKTGAGHLVDSYSGDKVGRISTAPAEVASRWATSFPYGEIMSELNNDARVYIEAKRRGVDPDKFLEDSWEKHPGTSLGLADRMKLPDKLKEQRKGGVLIEMEVDARSLPDRTSLMAQSHLRYLDEGHTDKFNTIIGWNTSYEDVKIHPSNIKSARIVEDLTPEASYQVPYMYSGGPDTTKLVEAAKQALAKSKGIEPDKLVHIGDQKGFRETPGLHMFNVLDETGKPITTLSWPMKLLSGGQDTAEFFKKYVPIWRSRMNEFLGAKLPGKGSGGGLANLISGWASKGEFKPDELKWSGLVPWLQEQKGTVTKQDVVDYLNSPEHRVEIEEVVKKDKVLESQEEAELHRLEELNMMGNLEDKDVPRYVELQKKRGATPTKFSQYVLPGGENYREMLFILPGNEFVDTHWPEHPGTFAWTRMQDFLGPNGEKILLLDEIQSGQALEGRRKGFAEAGRTTELETEISSLESEMTSLYERWNDIEEARKEATKQAKPYKYAVDEVHEGRTAYNDLTEKQKADFDKYYEILESRPEPMRDLYDKVDPIKERIVELREQLREVKSAPPAFPFSKNWHEVALKRMLRYAAENGYDQVGWTTGEQQAERYDLSKQVSSIEVRRGENTYDLSAIKDGERITIGEFPEDKLEGVIGKDLARKVISDNIPIGEGESYSGLDLKIGGEWAYNLYDRMVPQFLNKYAKQWGARVGETGVDTGPRNLDAAALGRKLGDLERAVLYYERLFREETDPKLKEYYASKLDDDLYPERLRLEGLIDKAKKGVTETVHSLPITPSMKKSVLHEGQYMFAGALDTSEWFKNVWSHVKESRAVRGTSIEFTDIEAGAKKLWDKLRGEPEPWTDYKRLSNTYLGSLQIAGLENERMIRALNKAVPDKRRQEAITNYIEAGGDPQLLKARADATKDPVLKRGYEGALNLNEKELDVAREAVAFYDKMLKEGQAAGILESALSNYINHVWKKDSQTARRLRGEINSGLLNTNFSYARKRIWSTYFDGEQAGRIPKDKSVSYLMGNYFRSFNEAVAARQAIRSLTEGKTADGMPIVTTVGGGDPVPRMMPEESRAFEDVPPDYDMTGKPQGPDAYLIKPHKLTADQAANYRYIDHPALRKWKWIGNDMDGNPMLMQGDLWVHKDHFKHLKNMLGRSAISEHWLGGPVMQAVQTLKGTLLTGTPFHQVNVATHGLMHLVNITDLPEIDFSNPLQQELVRHGLMVYSHRGMADFGEGVYATGLVNKIPGIGQLVEGYGKYLFQGYIPRLKMKLATEAFERNLNRYSHKYDRDQILELTANQSNAAFGELNYKAIGRNPTLQDVFRLSALAPDFLEARLRFLGQAFRPGGKEQALALMRGALGLYAAGVIGNMLFSDDHSAHYDKPFQLVLGKKQYSLRSIPGDVLHAIKDRRNFIYWRLSPTTVRTMMEMAYGRDMYGRKRDFYQQVEDFFVTHMPIPVQPILPGQRREVDLLDGALRTIGVSTSRYRTSADQAMLDYFMEARIDRPARSEFEMIQKARRKVLELARGGKEDEAVELIRKTGEKYKLEPKKALDWLMEAQYPENVANFRRLPLEVAARVINLAEPEEEQAFVPILLDKISRANPDKLNLAMPQLEEYIKKLEERKRRNSYVEPSATPVAPEAPPEEPPKRFSILNQ